MDSLLRVLHERHSIRRYLEKPIAQEILLEIAKAVLASPSARNTRPWEVVIITDEVKLAALSKVRLPWHFLVHAAAALVIAQKDSKYIEQEGGAATQNALLAAQALGIGGCWLGLYPNMEAVMTVQDVVDLPEEIVPISIISLGYPEHQNLRPARSLEISKIHYERFTQVK